MNKTPFFSIGIPVYNTQKWIGNCLDSILNQNFSDFEIICVDDGSADDSLGILNSYAEMDNRIKVISRSNDGPATARNSVLMSACGQYINFIDSDDEMCENALAEVFEFIKEKNYPDVVETGFCNIHGKETYVCIKPYPGDEYFSPQLTKDERAAKMWLDKTYYPSTPAKFVKRSFIIQNGITFNPQYIICEDSDFSFRLHRKADSIAVYEKPTFIYIAREGSVMTTLSCKAYYSAKCYETFFYNDVKYWNVSDFYKHEMAKAQTELFIRERDYSLSFLHGKISKAEVMERISIIENFIGDDLKKLPVPKGKNGIIFTLYKLIGMKRTVSVLYDYLKFKGVICDE